MQRRCYTNGAIQNMNGKALCLAVCVLCSIFRALDYEAQGIVESRLPP
ncbi:hypothetical protein FLA_5244 [Filimonas lacunae]|nr:hypothetical protein FLA_5244 [Filimonas lacunae]